MMPRCPLCGSEAVGAATRVRDRVFGDCAVCRLVFLMPEYYPSEDEARRRYLKHRNTRTNEGYVRFLRECIEPVAGLLRAGTRCLDYGSGPEPTLCHLLRETGATVDACDPLFAPDSILHPGGYDILFCIETAEHFQSPGDEFSRLDSLLAPGGRLVLRTMLLRPGIDLINWWYVRDLTHVCFYRSETLTWLSARFGWTMSEASRDIFVFCKRAVQ